MEKRGSITDSDNSQARQRTHSATNLYFGTFRDSKSIYIYYFLPKNEFNVFCPFFPAGALLPDFGRAGAEACFLSSSFGASLLDADLGLVVISELSTAGSSSAKGLGVFSFPLPFFAALTFRPAFFTSSTEGSSDSEVMLSYSEYVSTARVTYLKRQADGKEASVHSPVYPLSSVDIFSFSILRFLRPFLPTGHSSLILFGLFWTGSSSKLISS